MAEELVKKKVELLAQQKAKSDRLNDLLSAPGGFNELSKKTCKNLEAAITASKRPGYFPYFEQPDNAKAIIRSGEVKRLQQQVTQLQKQIDQLTERIDTVTRENAVFAPLSPALPLSPKNKPKPSLEKDQTKSESKSPNVHSLKQWLATYGSPKEVIPDMYTSFTPGKKVYGGTDHYSAFRSQSSTMKKGRLTT